MVVKKREGPVRTLYAKPEVIEGHTVLFPADFTDDDRRYWLNDHRLLPVGQTAPETCPRCKGRHLVCEFHQTEPWEAEHSKHSAGAPCPVSSWGADLPVHFLDPGHLRQEMVKVDHRRATSADKEFEAEHEKAA
jgi:hypothetical protein